jgi:hypothetical protein
MRKIDLKGGTSLPRGREKRPILINIQSSEAFVKDFVPPDYVLDGILQRRFFYSLTGPTGSGKTAIALLIAAHVALGRSIGNRETMRGRVVYLAAENPDDARMRWIAMAQHLDFNLNQIEVLFWPGTFKLSDALPQLKGGSVLGDVDLVIVDTSMAFYEGDDENSNAQMIAHAKRFRELTEAPSGPCVLVLTHPTKNAAADNLVPRGGGAFLNEVDGNLCVSKSGSQVTLHWQGKFRGPEFNPVEFQLKQETHERLKTSRGEKIPTVIASYLSDAAQEELAKVARGDEDRLLAELHRNPKGSQAELARALGWTMRNGDPYKVRVARVTGDLKKAKLITVDRDGAHLTDKGLKAIGKDAA